MIEYVTIDQAAELDAFVLRQPNCHFMQTSAWGRVKEGWGWTGILCRDEKGEIIGSMAILEHRIRHMHTGFLYAPRGPIFRDGDYATLEALVDAMRALAEKRGDYMIRIDPMLEETDTAFLDEVRRLGFTVNQASDFSLFQPRMCYVLDLQGFTPESLLAYYNKTKRYDIRRAERRGLVRSGADGASGQRRIGLHQRRGAAALSAFERQHAAQRPLLPAETAEHAARPLRAEQREQQMLRANVAVAQGAGLPRGAAQHLDQGDGQLRFSHSAASFWQYTFSSLGFSPFPFRIIRIFRKT